MPPIEVSNTVPDTNFMYLEDGQIKSIDSDALFKNRIVLVIGVIGAFTPSCTSKHLPEYIPYAKNLIENKVVDSAVCISAADPFVLDAWSKTLATDNQLQMLTDTNAEFARQIGLSLDLSAIGMGMRSTRYALLVQDKIVRICKVEKQPQEVNATSKSTMAKLIDELFLH